MKESKNLSCNEVVRLSQRSSTRAYKRAILRHPSNSTLPSSSSSTPSNAKNRLSASQHFRLSVFQNLSISAISFAPPPPSSRRSRSPRRPRRRIPPSPSGFSLQPSSFPHLLPRHAAAGRRCSDREGGSDFRIPLRSQTQLSALSSPHPPPSRLLPHAVCRMRLPLPPSPSPRPLATRRRHA